MTASFTVEMPELSNGIRFVRNALGSPHSGDFSSQIFRIEVSSDKLTVFAANTKIACRVDVQLVRPNRRTDERTSGFVFGVHGHKFAGLVENSAAAVLAHFTVDRENLQIEVGSATVNLETFNPVQLHKAERELATEAAESGPLISTELLIEALYCTRSCAKTYPVRPDHCHSELRDGRFVATDGHRVIIVSADGLGGAAVKVGHHQHIAVLSALSHVPSREVRVIESASHSYLTSLDNKFIVGFAKIERAFPRVEEKILDLATAAADEVSVDKSLLLSMCRVIPFGLPDGEKRIDLELETIGRKSGGLEAVLRVKATNAVGRVSHEESSCGRMAKEPVAAPVSFEHMLSTLGVFKGDSVVDIKLRKEGLVIFDHTKNREVATVIPYRIVAKRTGGQTGDPGQKEPVQDCAGATPEPPTATTAQTDLTALAIEE